MKPVPIAVVAAPPAPKDPQKTKRQAPKGRQVDPVVAADLAQWLADLPPQRALLIECLHRINDRLGELPLAHLAALAQHLRLSQVEVYEVASFYHHFDIRRDEGQPAPAATQRVIQVRVCDSLPCAMAGSAVLLQQLQERLPAVLGTAVQVRAAPCIGRCDAAPAVMVQQQALLEANLETVQTAVWVLQNATPPAEANEAAALAARAQTQFLAYTQQGGYALWAECVNGQREVQDVIQTLEGAGLRGLGGAGFSAARKWRAVLAQPAPRLMAVNADEGEPGTFKDRWLLDHQLHPFLEGMLIAAWAVQAQSIVVYVRDEYPVQRGALAAALQALRDAAPALGLPTLPEVALRRGAGAYICGEESAMIESIEGKRGLPRLRPPYVAEVGLWGRPTLVHNIETLAWIPELLQRGATWFASHGRHGRQGLRRFSVSGRVLEPGVKLAPAGITLRELIDEFCGGMWPGHTLYAYLPGGASGGILPAHLADVPLDFDTLQPHGCFIGSAAVIVLSQADSAVAAAQNVMRFFEHESCGQCTPCRAGTAKASTLMAQPRWDLPLLAELSQVMRDASICGLGQAAPQVMDGVIQHFAHELTA